MRIRLLLNPRLGAMVGFREMTIDLPEGSTVRDALTPLEMRIARGPGAGLLRGAKLHPAILAVVNGANASASRDASLADGDTIELLVPLAGG